MACTVGPDFACDNFLVKSSLSSQLLLSLQLSTTSPRSIKLSFRTILSQDHINHNYEHTSTDPHTIHTTNLTTEQLLTYKMQLQAYFLGLLASASTIKAQAIINWVFYEAGTDCSKNWHDEPTNEDYWTETNGFCLPMNTVAGEYDVVVSALVVGQSAVFPAMYACPTKHCDLENCVLMAADGWSGEGIGCQHMYDATHWWINGVSQPWKRDAKANETVGWKGAGLGPRAGLNETRTTATEFHA